MSRRLIPTLLASCTLAGCFYVDPINQRPALDIRPDTSDPVYRTGTVGLTAIASDPEKHDVRFAWSVYRCADATDRATCDAEPWYTGGEPHATIYVAPFRADGSVTTSLLAVLDGTDDHGATADPSQQLPISVLNHPPDLEVRKDESRGAVRDTPIDLFAAYGDPDDFESAEAWQNVTLEWSVRSPAGAQVPLTVLDVPQVEGDTTHHQAGMRFMPDQTGDYAVAITAVDKAGARITKPLTVTVKEDEPPCLDTWLPIAPTDGNSYPLTDPTLFQVAVVRDDLDVYPPVPSDPFLKVARFEWSLKVGAGARQDLATTANSVALDPASYPPGTALELRVEIFDRKNVPITCADADQTCAVVAGKPSCIQRQTWRAAVR